MPHSVDSITLTESTLCFNINPMTIFSEQNLFCFGQSIIHSCQEPLLLHSRVEIQAPFVCLALHLHLLSKDLDSIRKIKRKTNSKFTVLKVEHSQSCVAIEFKSSVNIPMIYMQIVNLPCKQHCTCWLQPQPITRQKISSPLARHCCCVNMS